MKLIVQIPCHNEEENLAQVLADLPDAIPGIDEIETLVINDGSDDKTRQVAGESGVDHIVNLARNKGLAFAWSAGIDAALRRGADIIVNTDGDNQYAGADIAALVRPILEGEADIVIGARPIERIEHFSWLKKRLQRLGSWVVARFAGVSVPDATSGFRAYDREAALRLNVSLPQYTHTADTIIRAARSGMAIKSVPVRVNGKTRESRLFDSTPHYLWNQALVIFRVSTMLQPLKVFGLAAAALMLLGLAGCVRFLVLYLGGSGSGHVQSLLLSAVLIIVAFVVGMLGLAADMTAANRRLIEETLYRLKKLQIESEKGISVADESDA